MTNMVNGIGTTKYTYTAAGQLPTEDGLLASHTVTNVYQLAASHGATPTND